LESFIHVLSWIVLRFIPNILTPAHLAYVLEAAYDGGYWDSTVMRGGDIKLAHLERGFMTKEIGLASGPLRGLFAAIIPTFAARYFIPADLDLILNPSLRELEVSTQAVMANLRSLLDTPSWLLETFNDCLSREDWPDDS
jgi:hypothetical protein